MSELSPSRGLPDTSAVNPEPPRRDWDPGAGRPWTGRARIVALAVCGLIAIAAVALAVWVFVDEPIPTITPTSSAPSVPDPVGP